MRGWTSLGRALRLCPCLGADWGFLLAAYFYPVKLAPWQNALEAVCSDVDCNFEVMRGVTFAYCACVQYMPCRIRGLQ
jgi:hypothetical protein